MDTSKEYQDMCVTSYIYLKDVIHPLFSKRLRMLYVVDGTLVRWADNVNTSNCERAIPLWEQDQLQEMLSDEPHSFGKSYEVILMRQNGSYKMACKDDPLRYSYMAMSLSLEVLWLGLVMHEKYQMKWNGTEWVKE